MSYIEDIFENQLILCQIDGFVREFKFSKTRKWRADFCWIKQMIIVEIEGCVFQCGRHVRGKGFTADCEKYNEATILGYRVLRVTTEHVQNGKALDWVERLINDP